MSITNVPKIFGPDYGGVIYGLSLSQGFSSEPTKLTLDIVNKNGVYQTPILNKPTTISFSNFIFQGTSWSYEIKESSDEKTLHITFFDNSIILDRHYVLLWKRGFLNYFGREVTAKKTFDFRDETILVPTKDELIKGFPYTKWIEKNLTIETVDTKYHTLDGGKNVNSVILVGSEKISDSECDIGDTYYTFNDLKQTISYISMKNAPNNTTWRATHEGTLREVLSSWCADLGYDYYWDFQNNCIQFYDVSIGITNSLPNSTASNIITKESGASMQGTFRQYGLAYTAKPKAPIKSFNGSLKFVTGYDVAAIDISYFGSKINKSLSLDSKKPKWANRSKEEFTTAGMIGYISEELRNLYCFQKKHWQALGIQEKSGLTANKITMIDFLKKSGYEDVINNLEKFDSENLTNYEFNFINRDESYSKKWYEIEQKLLTYHGRWYRIPDHPGNFFYCSQNITVDISISVDPTATQKEENSEEFAGKLIYDRGGSMSHDASVLQDLLKLNELTNEIENCVPRYIELKQSGLLDEMVKSKLITAENSKKVNTLVIFASKKFIENKLGFTEPNLDQDRNELETTWIDEKNKNASNGRKNCKAYEEYRKQNSCTSLEEQARKQSVIKQGGLTGDEEPPPDDWVSGLNNNLATSCTLKTIKGQATFCLPSDSTLRVITTYEININQLSTYQTNQFLWSVGAPGMADDVAEVRIANENITDPGEDYYRKARFSELIRPADSEATSPNRTVKYVFAGNPEGISLSPSNGLSSLDVSLSSDGFTTSATFSTRPSKPSKQNNIVRYVNSQFNRASYNAA